MERIDGTIGGGGVVRTAVGLAAATGTPIEITDVRADRPSPGLKAQHVAAVDAARQLTDAAVDGLEQGVERLTFRPDHAPAGDARVAVATAGAVGLVLQPAIIAAAGADEQIRVRVDGGATMGKWAPPVPALRRVAAPTLARVGLPLEIDVRRHGAYPAGGALVAATAGPAEPAPLDLVARDDADRVTGVSIQTGHLADQAVAERQRRAARKRLKDAHPSLDLDIGTETVEAASPGSCIALAADCGAAVLGGDAVGEQGTRAEVVGQEAAEDLLEALDTGAPLDPHMADHLVPLLALYGGRMRVAAVTDHVRATVAVARQIVDQEIAIEGDVVRTR